jgi:DNA-binding MarR family transcriptional regulator
LVQKARCESDARVVYAELTPAGLAKIAEARSSHAADVEELFGAPFSDEEKAALDELLARLPLADTACQA